MKNNFCLAGHRRSYNLTFSPELISGLVERPVNFYRPEAAPQLRNFHLAEDPFPIILKFRGEGRPVEGTVYSVLIMAEEPASFRDQEGTMRLSRERLVVRVYHRTVPAESQGELRFVACGKEGQVEIWPAPKFLQSVHGKERHGYLWVAEPGVEYKIRQLDQVDEILFEGNVVVETMNPERMVPWTASVMDAEIEGGKKLTVYDRRRWRESILARATHIRRTLGRGRWARSFEFVTLRDADPEKEAACSLSELIGEAVC